MINNTQALNKIGFSVTPSDISKIETTNTKVQNWLNQIDFNSALHFYGLNKHTKFYNLFRNYMTQFQSQPDLQTGAYILNKYLFSTTKYNSSALKRNTTDFLPALILLSGYRTHQENMTFRNFDSEQFNKHRFRIYETCTRGLDVYNILGTQISQLLWGSFFINTHIIEIGRLQYEINIYDYNIPNFRPEHNFCINIHVPRGTKLSNESVSDSLSYARNNIQAYFSESPKRPDMFIESWLLGKKLDLYLPAQSNIKSFRNRFDILYETPHSSIPKFLFNTSSTDVSQYQSDTYLRQRIKSALLNGERFYDGIAILRQEKIRQ